MALTSGAFSFEPPASGGDVRSAETALGISLPQDYHDFLLRHDGGEGFVGEYYLILWKASELVPFNKDYEVDLYAPGFVIFASNGGGEGFAFDTRREPFGIVQVPFVGLSHADAVLVAGSFIELLERFEDGHDSLI